MNEGTYGVDDILCINGLNYKIVDIMGFDNPDIHTPTEGQGYSDSIPNYDYKKAMVLRCEETGEYFFHFRGTGDGNWGYNVKTALITIS